MRELVTHPITRILNLSVSGLRSLKPEQTVYHFNRITHDEPLAAAMVAQPNGIHDTVFPAFSGSAAAGMA